MSSLRVQFRPQGCPAGTEYKEIRSVMPGELPGSMSDNSLAGRRDVLLFYCCGPYSIVARARPGIDVSDSAFRVLDDAGAEVLARLGPGEPYERTVRLDSGLAMRVRWTHEP